MSAVVILGVFVADTAYRAERQPRLGETILGSGFALGPGGKGSNQAVAAARLGADVTFISKIGEDPFGDMAMALWAEAGVKTEVQQDPESYTGAASIFLEESSGDNAIIVCPGAAIITLGDQGAYLHGDGISEMCQAFDFAPVAETTGAGDAFNGAFAVALARGDTPLQAVRFGCVVAGISVTRPGTAQSMPTLEEVEQALGG